MIKLAHWLGGVAFTGIVVSSAAMGCAGAPSDTSQEVGGGSGGSSGACQSGTFRNCTCGLIGVGTQSCADDGSSWGACSCTDLGDAGSDAAPMCNDGTCNGTETCVTCPADCGQCPACSLSPSCTGASSAPSNATALATFNNAGQAMYTSGAATMVEPGSQNCSDPLLKMRVSQILIHKNGAPGSLEMFCVVQADDGQSSQIMVTPDYMNLSDNNAPLVLSPGTGTFWGEATNGVKLSQFNITVTYQCFMVETPGALEKALTAIAGFAGAAAGLPGNPYGWVFGVGGAAAAAGAALAATGNGATSLFNVEQTIDAKSLLDLTNGRTWIIEQKGSTKADGDCNLLGSCDWDWELDVEAWGCAAPKGQTPK